MEDACMIVDEVQQLLFKNTSLMILMHGFCIRAQDDIQEMEYLAQGIDILLENQRSLQTKIDLICDKVYKTVFSDVL